MTDDVWNQYELERRGREKIERRGSVECSALRPLEPSKISPRPWAYGQFLLFGSAAVIGAVDGGGKGAISVGMMLAIITGRPLLGERVWRSGSVAIVSYEDDETEWLRRFTAACIHYHIDYATVLPNIHFIRKRGEPVCFADMRDGIAIFPDGDEIVDRLNAIAAAVLVVDPFNHTHTFEDGNNNVLVAKVALELSRIARDANTAVLVLHHLRKGSTGNPDDLMGATSLRSTFRSCRILARMTPEVAERMMIVEPWRYIRIAGSKENYAPPPEKSSWFKLEGVSLGNATEEYPDGDDIGVATVWQARSMFDGMDSVKLGAVFAALRQTVHGPTKQAKHTPWAGKPLVKLGGRTEREAGTIIKAWIDAGVLVKGEYYHADSKHTVSRVTLSETKASAILNGIAPVHAQPE